jgi:hypothetical protein
VRKYPKISKASKLQSLNSFDQSNRQYNMPQSVAETDGQTEASNQA